MYHDPEADASTCLHHNLMIDAPLLERLAARHGLGSASIVLEAAGEPEAGASLAARLPLYPASMIKVPIAIALALQCEARILNLDDERLVDVSNITTNDAPSPLIAGCRATLGQLARAMLSASDNVATNVLIDVLGRETIGPACAPFGLVETAVRRKLSGSLPLIEDPFATGRNAHPARDAAMLFHEIERRARSGTDFIYDALAAQVWNDKLSRGLRAGDRFAHKTGDTDDVSHDGGILTLEDGRRFVLVVYTSLPAGPETDPRFGDFARELRALL
jgi:beta-lactamase class A